MDYKLVVNPDSDKKSMKSFASSHPSYVMSYEEGDPYQYIQNPDYVFFGVDNERMILKI